MTDVKGDVIRKFDDAPKTKGFHAVDWDLRRSSTSRTGGRNRFGGASARTGTYLVTLKANGKTSTQLFSIKADPNRPADAVAVDEELEFWLELLETEGGDDD